MRLFRSLLTLLALCAAQPAFAASDPVPGAAADKVDSAALFVELVVNGQAKDGFLSVAKNGDHLWVDADTLRKAGIDIRDQGRIDVAAYPGFRATYDEEGQRLLLDVPAAMLPTSKIAGTAPARLKTTVSTGALLNYDLYAQRTAGITSVSLWSEQRVFGPVGTLSNTGSIRWGGSGRKGYVRYDTTYRYIDEDRAIVAEAGDTITGALPWNSAVRIGGVQIARSFRTRPDLITVPLPDFAGMAAVPSGVDLFVDGYRQQHADVGPGRFVLDNVPVVNGAGEARVVTTDAVGRQVSTVIPFYVAPELLHPGLSDFSASVGALRRGYGLKSFGYGRLVATASGRVGLTSRFTLEGHGEAASGLVLGGIGGAWAPGRFGAFHGSAAVSRRAGATGTQVTVGYTYTSRRFSLGAEHIVRSSNFTDLAGFDLANWRGGSRSDRVSGSVVLNGLGSLGVGYIDARTRDGSRARIASASFSLPLARSISAFAAADYDIDRKAFSAQLRIVVPLGGGSASAGVSRQPNRGMLFEGDYARSVPTDGGFGFAASAATGSNGGFYGQASGTWRGDAVQIDAGASTTPGSASYWAGVTGAVALLNDKVYVANQLPDAFAVIVTDLPKVPVYYENQLIGRTERDGRLFVPRVTAYHPSRFSIDTIDLPIGAEAATIEARVALREGTGAVIPMTVAIVRSGTVVLLDAFGKPFPAGTMADLSTGGQVVVGWDGIVSIDRLPAAFTLSIARPTGVCRATVAVPADAGPLANLGSVRCE
ncbi:fimbrial biogenesis outer membrane usher protein [Sphingomonas panacisoli]|uniref:Fimbrial biogenesis outer membrane usher protein n=1 Tax=Sphingomonas panacisoli TaxID=1813879 RepID=A0A5B8LJ11_9SPHN|nr:fimbria/pilus outer membrane usher protein [Sphingomonas panacisoli]QDZ08267.1 fimbrial biogenesis outer membrane usher protein [Sphingomonas panacisoli]